MGEIELGAAAEATVQAYRELASDSEKRLALALDQTCVQFLAYVIAEGVGSLVQGAVDTLELITKNPECRPPIAKTFGVLEALQEMVDDARYTEELRSQATCLFTCLQFSLHIKVKAKDASQIVNKDEEKENPLKTTSRVSIQSQDSTESISSEKSLYYKMRKGNRDAKEKSFLGPSNSMAKTVTLFIEGMSEQIHRKKVEEELVRVRGLISIVFDLQRSRVTCRIKRDLSADRLAAAVKKTEYEAKQVINGPEGEVIVTLNTVVPSKHIVEELPSYLPEEDALPEDGSSAVATSGSFKEAASSFFSAAANVLQSSFYW